MINENTGNPAETLPAIAPLKSVTIRPSTSRLITTTHHTKGKPFWHIGEYDTLTYCVSGLCVMHIDGNFYLLRPGQFAFSPAGKSRGRTPISEDLALHEVSIVGNIDDVPIPDRLRITDAPYVVNLPEHYKQLTKICFEQILGQNTSPEGYLFRTAATANLLGIYFDTRAQTEKSETVFSPVLQYMHENLDKDVTLPELAALLHMQPTYFIRMFKKMFDQSPISYFKSLRIVAAIELLSYTSLPISSIGPKIGIPNPYHFSNFFKNHCGISPSQYREAIRDVKKLMEKEGKNE